MSKNEANERQVDGDHYRGEIQHWDYVLANNIPYLEAQIIKYLTRHRKKHGIKDLEKAEHFLQKLLEEERARVEAKEQAEFEEEHDYMGG